MMDNTQVLQLAQLHEQIQKLANSDTTSVEWEQEALLVTAKILPLVQAATSEFDFLEPFAKLVAKSHPKDSFHASFLHLVLLHLFNLSLYPILANSQKLLQLQAIVSVGNQPQELVSPFGYFFDLRKFAETNKDQIHVLLESMTQVLNLSQKLYNDPNPAWHPFGAIVKFMLQSRGNRDLFTMVFFHEEKLVALTHRSSLLASSVLVQKYSQLIMEILLLRPSLVATNSILKTMPGATRLIPIYPQQQHAALEIALTVPFRFVLDILNQSYQIVDFIDTTILACISIASQKILLLSASKQRLYGDFNSISAVHSLLHVMNEFGSIVAQHTLRKCGESEVAKTLFGAISSRALSLPPVSKPNYFFAERKLVHEDETIMMMQTLDEFSELQLSISLVLRSIGRIIGDELLQVTKIAETEEIGEKILVRNLQHTFSFLLAAKRCNGTFDETGNISKDIDDSIFLVTNRIFQCLESEKSLIWVTLFNLANDICYAEVSMVPTVLWFLKQAVERQKDEKQAALVTSGLSVFIETFGNTEETEGYVELTHSEYGFLYRKSPVMTFSDEKPLTKLSSGRVQSVHIDKYKK